MISAPQLDCGTPIPPARPRYWNENHTWCLAGDLCSEQRAKCDSLKPCARCLKRGTECTYNRQPKRRGPPKGTANTMRERLNRLEAIYGAVKAEELLANGGMTSLGSMNGLRAMSSSGSMSGGDDEPMSPNGHFSPAQMVDVKPTMAQLAASSRQLDAAGARMTIGSILTPPASRPTPSSTSSSIAPTRTAHSSTPPLFLMTSDSHISLMLPPEVFSSVMDTYFTLCVPTPFCDESSFS